MTTLETVQLYYDRLGQRAGWEELFADELLFTSLTSPVKRLDGKGSFLQATRRFYGSIGSLEVRELVVEGDHACALVRYEVRPPTGGPAFESHVAEFFMVKDERIATFSICFDTAPYPKS